MTYNSLPDLVLLPLEGEVTHCTCGAIGEDGHTFGCILVQIARRIVPAEGSAAHEIEHVSEAASGHICD